MYVLTNVVQNFVNAFAETETQPHMLKSTQKEAMEQRSKGSGRLPWPVGILHFIATMSALNAGFC